MKIFSALPATGWQKSESGRILKYKTVFVHLMVPVAFFVPYRTELLVWGLVCYFSYVFFWECGSHRYFSHRSFKTSRVFQFLLALGAAISGMRGPLWWASHHRLHHRYSDTPQDPHSPLHRGFWYSHMGWLFEGHTVDTDLDSVKDFSSYPELVWLNRYHNEVMILWATLIILLGQFTTAFGQVGLGLSAFVWLFCIPLALNLQAAFVINSLTHGTKPNLFFHRRFETKDSTTNSWLLSIPTMGCSWHNNHHRFMKAARAGFVWWQVDPTYMILRVLKIFGVVWELTAVPVQIIKEGWPATGTDSRPQA
ncbi:MAG: acyl-CoA desaturase [Bdellovibrionales bacterium]